MSLIKVAFLNNFRRLSRTMLALLGIIIGIGALISLVSVVDGVYKDASDSLGRMQGLMVFKGSMGPTNSLMSNSYEAKLNAIPGVNKAIPSVFKSVTTIDGQKTSFGFGSYAILGVKPSEFRYTLYNSIEDNIIQGDMLKDTDIKMILVPKTFADNYKKTVGSKVNLDDVSFKIKGVYEVSSMDNDIIANIDEVIREFDMPSDQVNYYNISLINPQEASKVRNLIKFKFDELEAYSQQDTLDMVGNLLGNLKLLVIVVSIIAAIVAGVGIINTMLMSVMERTKEIGTLKAVGWTNSNVMLMILLESLFIGIIGGVFGILFGYFGAFILGWASGLSTVVTFSTVISSFIFAIVIGVIGGLYPAYIASRLNPIEALRSE